jgi:hypothetical protein
VAKAVYDDLADSFYRNFGDFLALYGTIQHHPPADVAANILLGNHDEFCDASAFAVDVVERQPLRRKSPSALQA